MNSQVIQLPPNIIINEIKLNNSRYIGVKYPFNSLYFKLPAGLFFIKKESQLFFNSNQDDRGLSTCHKNRFFCLFKRAFLSYYKSFRLNGIGLKVKYDSILNTLELKLGFSHIIKLALPKHILKVAVSKNTVSFVSYDLIGLGNFLIRIKKLKIINAYKGSGISYRKEKIVLKKIKKK
jgi:hypothetical protein